MERFVDLVVNMTCPGCGSGASFYLRRKLGENSAKVGCTFATRRDISGSFGEGQRIRRESER